MTSFVIASSSSPCRTTEMTSMLLQSDSHVMSPSGRTSAASPPIKALDSIYMFRSV
jgi:hypothetical protein